MSYDEFEADGIRLNGEPADEDTLLLLDTLAREFIQQAPVVHRQSVSFSLESCGTIRLDSITETTDDATAIASDVVIIELEDAREKTIAAIQLDSDGKSCGTLAENIDPTELLAFTSQFLATRKLSSDEQAALAYLDAFALSISNDLNGRDLASINKRLFDGFERIKKAISAKALFGVFSMQHETPTTEGNLEVMSYWVLPLGRSEEALAVTSDIAHTLPSLSLRLTDFTTGYGNEFIRAAGDGQIKWAAYPINPSHQDVSIDDIEDNPELLASLETDDTPGQTDAQAMINAFIEAALLPDEGK